MFAMKSNEEMRNEALANAISLFLKPEAVDEKAKQQLFNLVTLPFIFRKPAAMPDTHPGMGATIGSVIATYGAIIPSAVGVDIGCGMIGVLTKLMASHLPDNLREIRDGIERRIPTGFAVNQHVRSSSTNKRVVMLRERAGELDYDEVDVKWPKAMGSLGGGNHFIEISLDELDRVWVVLHSGSRGIGNKLAQKHIKVAKELMKLRHIPLKDVDLAYFSEGEENFDAYIKDMLWAQDFALLNREEMMDRVMIELSHAFHGEGGHEQAMEIERINCHHNFAQKEHHFGKNVWITRKGAIQTRTGQMGIIPGSMGTKSYIVSGLENRDSFHSAPHGAGRRFSRTEARKRFTMDDFREAMKGIEHRESKSLIDELPGAYKDIDEVMENSKELVKVEHTLKQVLNVKGD